MKYLLLLVLLEYGNYVHRRRMADVQKLNKDDSGGGGGRGNVDESGEGNASNIQIK